MVRNHTVMTGPKSRPMEAVPRLWMEKSPRRMSTVMGTTAWSKAVVATVSPSTALSTLMAGVMMPSPKSSAAPASTSSATRPMPPRFAARTSSGTNASSARMPPSPRLSARMTKKRYFTVTTRVTDQITCEITPTTFSGVGATPCSPKHSWIV